MLQRLLNLQRTIFIAGGFSCLFILFYSGGTFQGTKASWKGNDLEM